MARRAALFASATLFVELGEDPNTDFTLQFSPTPQSGRHKCVITGWPAGHLETIERCLRSYRMPVIHEDEQSYFWVKTRNLMVAIGRVVEAFTGFCEFDPPEFWYYTPEDDVDQLEFQLEDRCPATHDRIMLTCNNWLDDGREDGSDEKKREIFDEALRQSGLCVPTSVLHEDDLFYASLTPAAARRPLESFLTLVNLHPALADDASSSRPA